MPPFLARHLRPAVRCAIVASLVSGSLAAQTNADTARTAGRAFSTITVRASGARNVNRERLHDFYDVGGGVEIEVATPFQLGEIGIAYGKLPFRAKSSEQPDFDSRLVSLRWGAGTTIAGPLGGRAWLALGDFVMRFNGPRVEKGLQSESELFVGAGASLELLASRRFGATLGASYHRVLLHVPVDLVTVHLGGRVTAPLPAWLRGVLE